MQKETLLKLIAETAYNAGYGAKKHFATYDIIEKLPGWVALISAAAAILALFIPAFEAKWVSATFIIISIGAGNILLYDRDKTKYVEVGTALTERFHELRVLYHEVKTQPDGINLPDHANRHVNIQVAVLKTNVAKQIFLSDWYAHYKFFWQQQTGWVDEQLNFTLFRDKLPLSFTVAVILASVGMVGWFISGQVTSLLCHVFT
ncbi:SLATT domain-containing protein [Limnohabitans sp.]|uniref:SLATT domain-containing protein n=1 Tax=Limnohabitans sp. TaxID=1907725 RepID=UPI00286EE5AA|nr:SLATT domain-containing protein [Limnohabitans sp.]